MTDNAKPIKQASVLRMGMHCDICGDDSNGVHFRTDALHQAFNHPTIEPGDDGWYCSACGTLARRVDPGMIDWAEICVEKGRSWKEIQQDLMYWEISHRLPRGCTIEILDAWAKRGELL